MVIPHAAVLHGCTRQPRPILVGVDNVSCWARPNPALGWVAAYHWHRVTGILQCFNLVLDDDEAKSLIIADPTLLGAPLLPNLGNQFSFAKIVSLQLASALLFASGIEM